MHLCFHCSSVDGPLWSTKLYDPVMHCSSSCSSSWVKREARSPSVKLEFSLSRALGLMIEKTLRIRPDFHILYKHYDGFSRCDLASKQASFFHDFRAQDARSPRRAYLSLLAHFACLRSPKKKNEKITPVLQATATWIFGICARNWVRVVSNWHYGNVLGPVSYATL